MGHAIGLIDSLESFLALVQAGGVWLLPCKTLNRDRSCVARLDSREERELTQKWLKIFAEELAPFYASWAHRKLDVLDLLNYTKVPHFTYWSFGEPIPVVEYLADASG